ncbi:MAG: hypothetical protein PHT60_09470 [Acidiphilium sp.]|nr:hypothetical protein [Acidiphilium sp.]MDD4935991.1 hypothetical protein [Acidiphilium sp.]
MSTQYDAKRLNEVTNAFVSASLSPALFESMTSNVMRIVEAEFALVQAITQAQFSMMEAMMRAGNVSPFGRRATPAETSAHDVKRPERVVA